jgi:hypothetical protein
MEIAHMILDCAKKRELREISENICFIGVKFNRNIKYKIYIIPKNDQLIVQYNNLALLINRKTDELVHVIKYFNNLISYDYAEYLNNNETDNGNAENANEISYEFTLNIGSRIVYRYLENSLSNSYFFNIEDIIAPLVYMINPVHID